MSSHVPASLNTGWDMAKEKQAGAHKTRKQLSGLHCCAMNLVLTFGCHGFQAWGSFPLSSAVSLRIQMPSFPQGAYNLNSFKQKQNKKLKKLAQQYSMTTRLQSLRLNQRLCPEVYFFPTRSYSSMKFYYWERSYRSLWFPFWSFFKARLDNLFCTSKLGLWISWKYC